MIIHSRSQAKPRATDMHPGPIASILSFSYTLLFPNFCFSCHGRARIKYSYLLSVISICALFSSLFLSLAFQCSGSLTQSDVFARLKPFLYILPRYFPSYAVIAFSPHHHNHHGDKQIPSCTRAFLPYGRIQRHAPLPRKVN